MSHWFAYSRNTMAKLTIAAIEVVHLSSISTGDSGCRTCRHPKRDDASCSGRADNSRCNQSEEWMRSCMTPKLATACHNLLPPFERWRSTLRPEWPRRASYRVVAGGPCKE